jgi:hypothetical protein
VDDILHDATLIQNKFPMTNKLKGFIIGFSGLFFYFLIYNSATSQSWQELNIFEKLSMPFFLGLLGGVVGLLIGSGVKEKK